MAAKHDLAERIEVEAFLADSVVAAEGKLYVQGGGWNIINTQVLPHRLPRLGIAVTIKVPYTATNELHKFDVRLLDIDGREISLGEAPPGVSTPDGKVRRIGGQFTVGRPPTALPGDEQILAMAVNLDGLLFEKQGVYALVLSVDDEELKHLRFRVVHLNQPTLVMR
jgi:hypothetical protein